MISTTNVSDPGCVAIPPNDAGIENGLEAARLGFEPKLGPIIMPGGGVPGSIGFVPNAVDCIRRKKSSNGPDKAGERR